MLFSGTCTCFLKNKDGRKGKNQRQNWQCLPLKNACALLHRKRKKEEKSDFSEVRTGDLQMKMLGSIMKPLTAPIGPARSAVPGIYFFDFPPNYYIYINNSNSTLFLC